MSKWKPCPFCKCPNWSTSGENHFRCAYCDAIVGFAFVDARPLEDALQARITELEAENAILTAELAELNNKAVFIQFENEDELPADISSDIYSAMFNCSHVDVVRLFPYIKENGQKYYLVMLREDE